MFDYSLTKYFAPKYLEENVFLKAYLELIDEIIFCCNMEAQDILSTMSFENMDDDFFMTYQDFFLDGLPIYNINKLGKLVLSEWFSLLHVRGELSDIDKLMRFGGSLKDSRHNDFELYHQMDVPYEYAPNAQDGLIYLITDKNITIDSDYFIKQQIPAGYRIGMLRTPDPFVFKSGDSIYLGEKNVDVSIHVDSGDVVNFNKDFVGDITFYRRRQFDQYYTFGEVYRSQYTINQLSEYHRKGYYFFGFELEHIVPLPSEYEVENPIYGCLDSTYGEFFIADGEITSQQGAVYSGTFADKSSYITFEDVDGGGNIIDRYNPGRALFPNTGWVDGTMITRYNPGRDLFELRGWEPGGCFIWNKVELLTVGGVLTETSSTSVVIDSINRIDIDGIKFGNIDLRETDIPQTGEFNVGTIKFSKGILTENSIPQTGEFNVGTIKFREGILSKNLIPQTGVIVKDVQPVVGVVGKAYILPGKTNAWITWADFSRKDLYDEDGQRLSYDSSKTYTVTGLYLQDGSPVPYTSAWMYSASGNLGIEIRGMENNRICYAEYEEV